MKSDFHSMPKKKIACTLIFNKYISKIGFFLNNKFDVKLFTFELFLEISYYYVE